MKKLLVLLSLLQGVMLCAVNGFEVNTMHDAEWKFRLKDGEQEWIFADGYYELRFANSEPIRYVPFYSEGTAVVDGGREYSFKRVSSESSYTVTVTDEIIYQNAQQSSQLVFTIKDGKLIRTLRGSVTGTEYIFETSVSSILVFPPAGNSLHTDPSVRIITSNGSTVHEHVSGSLQTPEILQSRDANNRVLRYHIPAAIQSGNFSVEWFTYLGSTDSDELLAIDDMPDGGVVVCGRTQSITFPGMDAGDTMRGVYDIVIIRFDSLGNHLWTTLYGGLYYETGNAIVVHDTVIYVGGATNGNDIPMINAYQDSTAGSYDAVILKLNFNGDVIQSSYFGAIGAEFIYGMDVDSSGRLVIGGSSTSASLPQSAGGFQPAGAGAIDGFVCVMNDSFAPIWTTFYGGSGTEDVHQLDVSDAGKILLVGGSFSLNFPCTPNAFQSGRLGNCDAYLVVFDLNGNRIYATYYGGSGYEDCYGVAGDVNGNVYMSGFTTSPDFNVTGTTIQSNYSGMNDAYILKFDSAGVPVFSTFYGGADDDKVWTMTMRGKYLYIAGVSYSTDLIMNTTSPQDSMAGYSDGFVLKMDTSGNYITSTYIGGNTADDIWCITVNADTMVTCAGVTYSTDLPITPGAFQQSYVASGDGFVVRFDLSEELFSSETAESPTTEIDMLRVYPVPAENGTITISCEEGQIVLLEVFDINGSQVFSQVCSASSVAIATEQWSGGVYSLRCVLDNGISLREVLIVK
jgi:hypothetical protein